jgi:hypothetical protein
LTQFSLPLRLATYRRYSSWRPEALRTAGNSS